MPRGDNSFPYGSSFSGCTAWLIYIKNLIIGRLGGVELLSIGIWLIVGHMEQAGFRFVLLGLIFWLLPLVFSAGKQALSWLAVPNPAITYPL